MSITGPREAAGVISAAPSAVAADPAATVSSRLRVNRVPLSSTIWTTSSCCSSCGAG